MLAQSIAWQADVADIPARQMRGPRLRVLGHGDANRLRGVTREARSKKQKPGVSAGLWFSDGDA
jgi:hypothetical protein